MTSGAAIRVLLLADLRLYRDGLGTMLRERGRFRVTAREVSALAWGTAPDVDVVVLDASHEGALASLRAATASAGAPVVVIGVSGDEEQILAYAEAGVIGFVEREATLEELVRAIEHAARGDAWCSPRVTAAVLQRLAALAGRGAATVEPSLTSRERQIVQLIAEGLSNKEIARRLYIELATVKNHVHNILEKLQVNRRDEAVARLQVLPGRRVEARGSGAGSRTA